jgi:hypothetical protein
MLVTPLVFDWIFSNNFMIFVQLNIEICLVFFLRIPRKTLNLSMILNQCLLMIYSKNKIFSIHSKTNIDLFLRFKLVKADYIDWKKKIDDGLKQMNSIEDEQIIEQYKSFYEVKKKNDEKKNFIFIFIE